MRPPARPRWVTWLARFIYRILEIRNKCESVPSRQASNWSAQTYRAPMIPSGTFPMATPLIVLRQSSLGVQERILFLIRFRSYFPSLRENFANSEDTDPRRSHTAVFYIEVNSISFPIVETFSITERLCGMIWDDSEIHWTQLEDGFWYVKRHQKLLVWSENANIIFVEKKKQLRWIDVS
jgi:hypothetical protein